MAITSPFLISVLLLTLLLLPSQLPFCLCRKVPTSPLTADEKAEELVHENEKAAILRAKLSHSQPQQQQQQQPHVAPTQVKDGWKLRSLWVSVTGKEPSVTAGSSSTQLSGHNMNASESISPNETLVDEARQVPGGPDPLHHSNQPPSP